MKIMFCVTCKREVRKADDHLLSGHRVEEYERDAAVFTYRHLDGKESKLETFRPVNSE